MPSLSYTDTSFVLDVVTMLWGLFCPPFCQFYICEGALQTESASLLLNLAVEETHEEKEKPVHHPISPEAPPGLQLLTWFQLLPSGPSNSTFSPCLSSKRAS